MVSRNTTTRDRHRAVIARGKPDCALCGEPIDYTLKYPHLMCFVVDHILPVIHHPELADVLSNKQPAHNTCNRAKSDRLGEVETAGPRTFVTTRTW